MKTEVQNRRTINLVRISLLVALSGMGAYLKLPSPVGSIAFDSLPGYLGVLLLGIKSGSLILVMGHLMSALTASFPLGPAHLVIALLMGGCGVVFGLLARKNILLSTIIATICNGIIVPLFLIPIFGKGFFMGVVPMLLVASLANIILSVVINKFFIKRKF